MHTTVAWTRTSGISREEGSSCPCGRREQQQAIFIDYARADASISSSGNSTDDSFCFLWISSLAVSGRVNVNDDDVYGKA